MAAQSKAIDQADPIETDRGSETDHAGDISKNDAKADLAAENASMRARLMRALAETENTRRQGDRRAEDAQRYAIANLARELLEVVDNLHRAIEASARAGTDKAATDGLVSGVVATDQLLATILKRFGVRPIVALNAPFDPTKHEAVMEVDTDGKPPRSVVEVLEDGYTLHDRLLRPARVSVTKSQPLPPQATEP